MAKEQRGWITKKNGKLYVRISYTDGAGKERELMRRAQDQKHAREILKELRQTLAAPSREQALKAERMTFSALAKIYEERKLIPAQYVGDRKIAGLRSLESPKTWLKTLVESFGRLRLAEITHGAVSAYKLTRSQTGLSIASVNRELEILRAALNFARGEGWLLRTPFDAGEPLISKADEVRRERVLTFAEEERLLAACVDKRAHLKPLIMLLLDTGMRRGEAFRLTWLEVDLLNGIITVRAENSKTAQARRVPITPRLSEELTLWREQTAALALDSVFGIGDTVKRSWRTACRLAGIEGLRLHDLRHTAVSRMVAAGLPHTEIMKVSGHTQITTFLRYLNPTTERIKTVGDRLAEFVAKEKEKEKAGGS